MEPKKEPSNTMIYVSNLPFETNDEELKELFKGFGIKTAYVARRKNGKSKGFGFVNLEKESDQKSAIEKVNGRDFSSRKLIARVAMNDDRRNEKGELKEEFKTQQNNQVASETVVYVSNLAWTVRDEDLKKIFAEFNPKVVTVATRRSGRSKGFGFVEFNNKEDREKALSLDQKSFHERTVTVKPSTGYRGDRQRDRSRNRSRDNRRRSRDNRNRSRDNNRRRSRDNRNRSRDNNRRSRENRNRSRDNNRRSREKRQNNNENRTENKNNNTTTTNNNTNHKQNENKPKETKQNTHKQNENKPKENNNSHKQNENKPKETTPKEKSNNNTNNNNKPKTTNKTKNFGKVVSNNRRTNKSKKQETKTNNNNNEVTTKTTSNTSTNKTTNEKPREKRNEFTLYVNNLPFELDDTDLKDVFAEFHPKSARIATTNSGRSKGYGFVEFNNSKDQNDALRALDQSEINDRLVTVKLSSPKERERRRNRRSRSRSRSRSPSKREPSTTTVHVSNLEFSIDDNDLEEIFKGLQITKAYVVKNQNGRSKGFGFVEFSNSEDQQKSLQKTGNEIKGRTIRVQASFVRDN